MRPNRMRHTFLASACIASLLATGGSLTAAAAKTAERTREVDGFTLAFVDADVRRVVDAVLGSMLEADYSVDPEVKGNITLRTRQPVPRESLLPLLESGLSAVDAVIVADGSRYRVIPRDAARAQAPMAGATPGSGSEVLGFASEVISLKNGSVAEVAKLAEQFLGKGVVAGTDPTRNQIMISGTLEERQAARALIARFDVDSLAGMNFELYRLENVDADTLIAEMERIFQPPFDIVGTRVRLVPLPRLRSVLVIGLDRADIMKVEPWIQRLDAGASGKRRLFSYAVQNGRAKDLATSLQLVLGMGIGSVLGPEPGLGVAPAGDVVPVGEPSDIIASQTPLPGSSTPVIAGAGGGPRIVPNDENNSLLIYANGEEYEFIKDALEKLDQPVAQVLIEATLAEVTLTNDFRFGVNFRALTGNATIINTSTSSGIPAPIFPGFSLSLIGGSAQAVLNTLQSRTNVRVLSAPKLIVLNNQTATLQVGDQVPIITQQSQSVGAPGAPIVNNVELRDTGVILKVTPRVNDSGTIILDIAQEVSDVVETTTSGINSPTIQQRRIASTVATRSGQMIALGGLIRDKLSQTRSGIPLLSQIPLVGGLFGTQGNIGSSTEFIILLTPTVVRSPQEVGDMVDAVIEGLDKTQPLVDRASGMQVGGRPSQR